MVTTCYILILLSSLFGCCMKVNAVEIPQFWINYIAGLLRKYETSTVTVAGEHIIINYCIIVMHIHTSIGENFYIPIEYQPPNFLHCMDTMPHPDQYLLPAVFIWNPVTYFTLQCPLCSTPLKQHNAYWADGSQSYKPRILHSFRCIVLLVSRIYQCSNNQILFAHDERVLKLVPNN